MNSDELLIEALKAKKEQALSNLYDKYAGAIYGVIIRICKNEAAAQDILQDTFLTVWNKSHQYNAEKGQFYTWVYRIARNKALNSLRKSKNLIQTEDLSVYTNKIEDEDKPQTDFQLKGAINKLETHHQRAIELVYFEGLTHQEAHKEMNVPLGTFKSYVRQALLKLRDTYGNALVFFLNVMKVVK